jgi:oxygen-independent coproporphyrinogen III oxidase
MTISAYIHIPFCSHKCDFCDFAAFAGVNHLEDEYCTIICEEISQRLTLLPVDDQLSSIFYGGGTPGLIAPDNLRRIQNHLLSLISLAPSADIELETTPHSVTSAKAAAWLEQGITRLSIGVESLLDDELQSIGRDHTRAQAYAGIKTATDAGFENINCDLMYALPTQTLETWRRSLEDLLILAKANPAIKHLSAYSLHLAGNSPLFSRFPKDSSAYPNEELYVQMYELLIEMTAAYGFEQYEISNFCRPGYQSKHNLSYWNHTPYLAFGVGAHRYVDHTRSSNWRSLARYMKDPLGNETEEIITGDIRVKEAIMLGLRMRSGIDVDHFQATYGLDLVHKYAREIEKLIGGGFLQLNGKMLSITDRGVPVSNSVIAELF